MSLNWDEKAKLWTGHQKAVCEGLPGCFPESEWPGPLGPTLPMCQT